MLEPSNHAKAEDLLVYYTKRRHAENKPGMSCLCFLEHSDFIKSCGDTILRQALEEQCAIDHVIRLMALEHITLGDIAYRRMMHNPEFEKEKNTDEHSIWHLFGEA